MCGLMELSFVGDWDTKTIIFGWDQAEDPFMIYMQGGWLQIRRVYPDLTMRVLSTMRERLNGPERSFRRAYLGLLLVTPPDENGVIDHLKIANRQSSTVSSLGRTYRTPLVLAASSVDPGTRVVYVVDICLRGVKQSHRSVLALS